MVFGFVFFAPSNGQNLAFIQCYQDVSKVVFNVMFSIFQRLSYLFTLHVLVGFLTNLPELGHYIDVQKKWNHVCGIKYVGVNVTCAVKLFFSVFFFLTT